MSVQFPSLKNKIKLKNVIQRMVLQENLQHFIRNSKLNLLEAKLLNLSELEQGIKGTIRRIVQNAFFISEIEIDAVYKNCHKCITIYEAISRLKDRYLILFRDAVEAFYGKGKYTRFGHHSPFLILLRVLMTSKHGSFQMLFKRTFTILS